MTTKKSVNRSPKTADPATAEIGKSVSDNGNPAADPELQTSATKAVFPIVGIGASAGGLDAFEKFFRRMPPDSEMAFVIVQHLDPTHRSQLTELVSRFTSMPVAEVVDGVVVEPNHVYIIPPTHDLAILHGRLHLMERSLDRLHRAPIDFFFRTLANDQQTRAVGIVLSGTGSEGALGIKAIKGEGGLVLVQEPQSAQYDGMPRQAVATGVADYVLPPERMPEALLAYARRMMTQQSGQVTEFTAQSNAYLHRILILLRTHTGHDFSLYKLNTVVRRIERRMTIHQLDHLSDYARFLQEHPLELDTLFRELLIEVTSFFRDPDAYVSITERIVPELFKDRSPETPIRIWVAGCSTGEEAYTLAMILRNYLDANRLEHKVQIFATDIDPEAIERSRIGQYPQTVIADLPSEQWIKYFNKEDNMVRVVKSIRDMVIFATQSVTKDPPFSRMDLISCRNMLIYMGAELQHRVLQIFHYALKPKGYLHLGSAETLGTASDLFSVVDRKWKLFQRRTDAGVPRITMDFISRAAAHDGAPVRATITSIQRKLNVRELVERVLLHHFAPAAVVINEKQDVLYVHGHTGKYLEPTPGEANLNLLGMARQGLRQELGAAIHQAIASQKDMRCENVMVRTNGDRQSVDVTVKYISDPPEMQGLMVVVFEDVAQSSPAKPSEPAQASEDSADRASELERELRSTKDYLQSTIEELEASNEELKSTNEELQSANEELQSTNEELETSKEELQSVNEELVTVNAELETNTESLAKINNDLSNLLASTDIGTVFLDSMMVVQRFTPATQQFINLIQTDIGRPLAHIATNFRDDHLLADAQAVLESLVSRQREVLTNDERWCLVRTRPYRTAENMINGVVITFVDITEQKRVQEQLRKLTRAIEQSPSVVMITDASGTIEYVNPKFTAITGYTPAEAIGQTSALLKSGVHPPEFYAKLWAIIGTGREWRGEFRNRKKSGELYWDATSISPMKSADGTITNYVAVKEDISHLKATETLQRRLATVLHDANDAIIVHDFGGNILAWNRVAVELYGWTEAEAMRMNVADVIPANRRDEFRVNLDRLLAGRNVGSFEQQRIAKNGQRHDVWVTSTILIDENGAPSAIASTEKDITGRRGAEDALIRTLRILRSASDWSSRVARDAKTPEQLLDSFCQLIVEAGNYHLALVAKAAEASADSLQLAASASLGDAIDAKAILRNSKGFAYQAALEVIRTGELLTSRQTANESITTDGRSGYESVLVMPLPNGNRTLGAVCVFAIEEDAFDEKETALLSLLTGNLSNALRAIHERSGA